VSAQQVVRIVVLASDQTFQFRAVCSRAEISR